MSSSPTTGTSQDVQNRTVFTSRRRTAVACTNCRRRKLRCIPARVEEPATGPCARCTRKHLQCEYITPAPARVASSSAAAMAASRSEPLPPLTRVFPPRSPIPSPGTVPLALPLPHTAPPPWNHRPRYSDGARYPDLSLNSSHPNRPPNVMQLQSSTPVPTGYAEYSPGHTPTYALQAAQAYQYLQYRSQTAPSIIGDAPQARRPHVRSQTPTPSMPFPVDTTDES
ncbi:hypothetical protein C8F04DRAFT_1185207 [Mycena alexandri]|uniref:Zn(2)-C6 fungal-type domain-containing protein n=1 Tax=Mycena alexandri TaxID=1745969 RepID=A0AAD6SQN2_9AGAR|nr:hypothetical protein C8F04DRAFT_1185207 [Mycena alexandri]